MINSPLDQFLDKVTCGDCIEMMRQLPPESIHMVMFSPPFWGLRDYGHATVTIWGGDSNCEHDFDDTSPKFGNMGGGKEGRKEVWDPDMRNKLPDQGFCSKCGAWRGQLGLEPTYQMYVAHLIEVGHEIKRVLRKDGSWYLNLGDTYAGSGCGAQHGWGDYKREKVIGIMDEPSPQTQIENIPAKCKLLIPYRVALALIDDGWTCRNDITWYKLNAMPSSVKDRLTCQTERIFHLVKSKKYFYDLDAIRVSHASMLPDGARIRHGLGQSTLGTTHPLGSNPGDVVKWDDVPGQTSQSIRKHSGYFGSNGKCLVDFDKGKNPGDVMGLTAVGRIGDFWPITTKPFKGAHFAVYPEALCELPIKSSCPPDGIVLDPMCGSGTTLVVAKRLGRHFIGLDLNPDYCEMARRRLAQVEWPLNRFIEEAR